MYLRKLYLTTNSNDQLKHNRPILNHYNVLYITYKFKLRKHQQNIRSDSPWKINDLLAFRREDYFDQTHFFALESIKHSDQHILFAFLFFNSINRFQLISLFGKRTIVNTLAIPKLIYIATILELPDENCLKKLNRTIFNFIWNTTERIKRKIVIGGISEGGIGLIDLKSKLRSLKSAWVSRLLKQNM